MDEIEGTTADGQAFTKFTPTEVAADEPIEAINLVPSLLSSPQGEEWLKKTIKEYAKLIKEDEEARSKHMEKHAKIVELYCGEVPPLPYPAEGAPGSHDPILTRTILLTVSRGWDQVCPAKGSIINVHANGAEDEEAAQRRNDHMNWQLREKVPNYVLGHLANYNRYTMQGHTFRVGWWNPVIRTTQFDNCGIEDFIVPYTRKDIDPLMRDVPRYARIRRYHRHQIEALGREGYYHDVKRLFDKEKSPQTPKDEDDDSRVRQVADEVDGVEKPITITGKRDVPRVLYDVYCWMQLPNENGEPEGDQRPVMLTYDKWSELPLSLVVREEDDPFDKARFDAEMAAFEMAQQQVTKQYQQAMMVWQDSTAQGFRLPEPQAPPMPQPPSPVRQRTLHTVIQYRCFDNPDGFYGLGIGHLLIGPTEFINALNNRYLIAADFQNMQGGFASKGAFGKRGEIRFQHGKFIETELEAGELAAGIKPMVFPGPSEGLWKMAQATKKDASTMVANVDTLSGEAGPTNETRTAAMSRTQMANQLTGIVVRVYLEAMKEEPRMLAHHNSLFLDEREIFWVTEPSKADPQKQQRVQKEVRREDYANPFDFSFTADQRFQTQPERVQTAQMNINQLIQSPYVQDAERGPVLFYAAFKKLYTAMEDQQMLAALGEPPQPPKPPQPPQPMAQEDENQMWFSDQDHPVLPTDPHEDHLRVMQEFQASPYFEQLSATAKQMAERHYRQHIGYMYKRSSAGGMLSGGQMGGQGSATGVAAPGGNGQVPGGAGAPGGQGPGEASGGGTNGQLPGGVPPGGPPVGA